MKDKVFISWGYAAPFMWWVGFVFHEVAFGLLSVFLPLYIVSIGGSLIDFGFMSAFAVLTAIPASFLWGYACEREGRYRRYILLSFLCLAIILCLFMLTVDVKLLAFLYVLLSFFHVAHEPPRNILIAEFYTRREWERAFAKYKGFTEVGLLGGLLLGFIMSMHGVSAALTLLACSGLHLIAFALSSFLVGDPLIIFERGLVAIERSVDVTFRGADVLSRISNGFLLKLKVENIKAFCSGLILFSLATNVIFTPMAIFLSSGLNFAESTVFVLFSLNSVGGIIGYFIAMQNRQDIDAENSALGRIALFRGLLCLLLVASIQIIILRTFTVAVVLFLMGVLYASFAVYTLALSMEMLPKEKVGAYNALESLGRACGSFIGPLIAEKFGFTYMFLASSLIFFAACAAFKIFK